MKRFSKDRKGATAMIIALMIVPLILAAGAGVDFSRVSSARAQLQASVDAAAIAGAGAWQNSSSSTNAYNVASAMYTGSAQRVSSFVTLAGGTPTISTYCSGTSAQCGQAPTTGTPAGCPTTYFYCIVVTANATLKNSLLSGWIPSEALSVTSVGTTNFPTQNNVGEGNFTHTSVGYGSDVSGIYAYAVPEDSNGNPEYGNVPAANTNCNSSSLGPLYYEGGKVAPAQGDTSCNFLLIGLSTGSTGTGSLSFPSTDPIAFSFVSFAGASNNTTGENDLETTIYNTANQTTSSYTVPGNTTQAYCISSSNCTQYTNEIYVNKVYYASGLTVGGKALYGYCPAHNLYGAINSYPNVSNDIVPTQDSIDSFSSSYMYLGYPPTYGTNHQLLPFLGPANNFNTAGAILTGTSNYSVQAVCPQWGTSGTNISAKASFNPATLGYSGYPVETVSTYSTYYPGKTYSDTTASNIYPPAIAGCTPVIKGTVIAPGETVSATPNASTSNPWWGWSPSNALDYDPAETSVRNCSFNKVSTAGVMTTTDLSGGTGFNAAPFGTAYNDCALIIQSLGTGVSQLPDYYTYITNPSAAPGTLGNAANITSMTPVYASGAYPLGFPGNAVITSIGGGSYKVTEPPGGGTDHYPPEDTSHQCYNPQNNGVDASTLPSVDIPNNDLSPAAPNDPVENAGLGALYCSTNPPPAYGVYWNDMGSYSSPPRHNDDLGYANAVTEFTCPTPAVDKSGAGGPATLSG